MIAPSWVYIRDKRRGRGSRGDSLMAPVRQQSFRRKNLHHSISRIFSAAIDTQDPHVRASVSRNERES